MGSASRRRQPHDEGQGMTAPDELERALYAPMWEMRKLDEATLVARVDLIQRQSTLRVMRTADDYRAELDRRERERQNMRLEWLTWVLAVLTVVLVVIEVSRLMADLMVD